MEKGCYVVKKKIDETVDDDETSVTNKVPSNSGAFIFSNSSKMNHCIVFKNGVKGDSDPCMHAYSSRIDG